MKQIGKLLLRNEGSATAPRPTSIDTCGSVNGDAHDPMSETFIVPPGIPQTPRGLAVFFTQEVRKHYDSTGKRWISLNNYRAYLRPAQTLLEEAGFEGAVRAIVYAVRVANHTPSFRFILQCSERFRP